MVLVAVGATPADAATNSSVKFTGVVWDLNLDSSPQQQAASYDTMISHMRQAAGHSWHGDMLVTTTDPQALILLVANVKQGKTAVSLNMYFTASDLTFRGWQYISQTTHHALFQLQGYKLPLRLGQNQRIVTGFGPSFQSIAKFTQTNRQNLGLSVHVIANAIYAMAGEITLENGFAARSVLSIIVDVSEAARFGGIAGAVATGIRTGRPGHLDQTNRELTDDWPELSLWGRYKLRFPSTGPLKFGQNPVHVLNTLSDLQHFVKVIKSGKPLVPLS
jgi:hypothetical protein